MASDEPELTYPDLPESVTHVLGVLAGGGHEVVLVGGSVRDRLLDAPPGTWDWDAATSADPEEVARLFPHTTWQNRYGTVTVRGVPPVEVTAYRIEGGYRDARRPDDVRFGATLHEDLARRDFTINALAWMPIDLDRRLGRLIDPFGGAGDLEEGILRTVGDPRERFAEDALRLLRAARFAARFDLVIDPETGAAIVELAPTVRFVSGERVRDELLRMLAIDASPSRALRLLERLGLLEQVLPEVAALRTVPQAKLVPGDALDHTLAAVDAAPADAPVDLRLAALLHDIGKARTQGGGHFIGHEEVGAAMAADVLARLRVGRARADRLVAVIRHHMYHYESSWSDAAVRRYIRRLRGVDRTLLFALRRADDVASGAAEEAERAQAELQQRIDDELRGQPALLMDHRLAVDGHDLQDALGLAPGPELGRLLERLTEAVLDDPSRNEREFLLRLAGEMAAEQR